MEDQGGPTQVDLSPAVVAVINATVARTVTETVADLPTIDQVNAMIDQRMQSALKTRPTVADVKRIVEGEISDLMTAIQEVKQALGEVVTLKESVAEIKGMLKTWTAQRDEVLDDVKADQAAIAAAHKEFSTILAGIKAQIDGQQKVIYGDPATPDGPASLLRRLNTVEGAKLDITVFEKMFLPVLRHVNDQRVKSEAQTARLERRRAIIGQVVEVLSVRRVGGIGAVIGMVITFLKDHL